MTNTQIRSLAIIVAVLGLGVVISVLLLSRCDYREQYTESLHPLFSEANLRKYNAHNGIADKIIAPMEISGKILNRYTDNCNHSIKTIDISLGGQYIYIYPELMFIDCNDDIKYSFYLSCRVGDSLYKKENSLVFTLKHEKFCEYFSLSNNPQFVKDTVHCK